MECCDGFILLVTRVVALDVTYELVDFVVNLEVVEEGVVCFVVGVVEDRVEAFKVDVLVDDVNVEGEVFIVVTVVLKKGVVVTRVLPAVGNSPE